MVAVMTLEMPLFPWGMAPSIDLVTWANADLANGANANFARPRSANEMIND